MPHAVLARVVRSGFVEGEHHGSAVALAADGSVVAAFGDVEAPIFPRSSLKPLQLVAMLRAGLHLPPHLLALGTSSHSGEAFHRDGVQTVLAGAGLTVDALRNTPDLPLGDGERALWVRTGAAASSLAQNCSGKHAAMLATCVLNGWDVARYLQPDHPLQQQILATVADLAGAAGPVGVDGCGAPVIAVPLVGLARAFATIAASPGRQQPAVPEQSSGPERLVAQAVSIHPDWLGGTGRDVTRLLRAVPGAVAKDGAEAVYAIGLPDGRAVAVKIADGADRARLPVLVALLRRLGAENDPGVDVEALERLADVPVLGHGAPVGRVEAVIG